MELKYQHRAKSRCLQTSSYERGGDGDFSSTAGPQARGPRPSAKMSESRCLLKQTASSERNLRMAGGANFEARSEAMLRENERWRAKEVLNMVDTIDLCIVY